MELRWLQGDELKKIEPHIRAHGWVPLNPALSRALVAFEGNSVMGFVCMSCIPHVEPLWIAEEQRGTGLAEEMTRQMADFLYEVNAPEAYIVASSVHAEKIAEKHHMERVKAPVFYKRGR